MIGNLIRRARLALAYRRADRRSRFDKNGNRIREGDKVRTTYAYGYTYEPFMTFSYIGEWRVAEVTRVGGNRRNPIPTVELDGRILYHPHNVIKERKGRTPLTRL